VCCCRVPVSRAAPRFVHTTLVLSCDFDPRQAMASRRAGCAAVRALGRRHVSSSSTIAELRGAGTVPDCDCHSQPLRSLYQDSPCRLPAATQLLSPPEPPTASSMPPPPSSPRPSTLIQLPRHHRRHPAAPDTTPAALATRRGSVRSPANSINHTLLFLPQTAAGSLQAFLKTRLT